MKRRTKVDPRNVANKIRQAGQNNQTTDRNLFIKILFGIVLFISFFWIIRLLASQPTNKALVERTPHFDDSDSYKILQEKFGFIRNLPTDTQCQTIDSSTNVEKCDIEEKTYWLKEVPTSPGEEFTSFGTPNQKSNPFRVLLLHHLFNEISDKIRYPNITFFFSEKNNKRMYYTGAENINDFTPASSITDKIEDKYSRGLYAMSPAELGKLIRPKLEEAIGKDNIIKLAVLSTFTADIANNWKNWGFDKNKNLIVIDSDFPVRTLKEYCMNAIRSMQSFSMKGIYFSSQDFKALKKEFEKLSKKKAPSGFHHTVDFTEDAYHKFLDLNIQACDAVIKNSKNNERDKNNEVFFTFIFNKATPEVEQFDVPPSGYNRV